MWIVHGFADYESNSTGLRGLRLYNLLASLSIGRSEDVRNAVNGAATRLHAFATIAVSDAQKIVLQTYQSSGGTRNVTYTIEAIRIR